MFIDGIGYFDPRDNILYVSEDVVEEVGEGEFENLEEFLRFHFETDDDRRHRHNILDDIDSEETTIIRNMEYNEDAAKQEALHSILNEEEDLPPIIEDIFGTISFDDLTIEII